MNRNKFNLNIYFNFIQDKFIVASFLKNDYNEYVINETHIRTLR